ncbi:HD domain-containing protein [Cloacibacterium sp. TD35]|uniref:HD domain-containing protein n=1 Tax=Cloacibacterium sp. TD35 TaxID=2976818 RepID=UPI00237ED611|nr:HD domain-containing protein [Cloacibacterium sp. TD35]WDT68151.1 HD domain-containing protein [Cloacibacterium sp. TD35]
MKNHITLTINSVKEKLEGAEAGHDWFHIERVWKLSKKIAEKEGGNLEVIELSALLHDIADPKFHNGDETLALKISKNFLEEIHVDAELIEQVLFVIKNISFKNRAEAPENPSLELQIVQDADRLDAIGAIGIARTFNFGGFKNNLMYHPEIKPNIGMNKEEYKKSNGTTINHFYEKLLLLKDLMNTETAKKIASERHDFMLQFLDEFYKEWNVEF